MDTLCIHSDDATSEHEADLYGNSSKDTAQELSIRIAVALENVSTPKRCTIAEVKDILAPILDFSNSRISI